MSMNQSIHQPTSSAKANPERGAIDDAILSAVHEIAFGVIEIVVHDRRVMEIRQTRRTRIPDQFNR